MMPGSAAALLGRKANWRMTVQRLMAERRLTWDQATREAGRRGGRKASLQSAALKLRREREQRMGLT